MTKYSSRLVIFLLILAIAAYTAFFTTQLFLHYHSFGSRSLDLGNINQATWNTLHGRPFHQTNQPGANNRLSLHFEPILIPLSLLYLIYSGPEILFLAQSLVVALGAIPVFALARRKLNSDGLALIFAAAYLMFPAMQGATLLDFHPVTLAPTFLLAAFYYLETDRPKHFALFALLAAACKEDISLLVMMMGFYAFFINRQRRLGLATVVLSGLWAFLAVFVIPPVFADTGNIHWNRYGHLGDTPLGIIANLFIEPQRFLTHLQAVDALTYLRLLLTPTAFTALFNPVTLLLALPSLGINLLSNFPPMQRVNSLIYAAPLVPAIFISSIYGAANLKRMGARLGQKIRGLPEPSRLNFLLGALILVATLIYQHQYGYLPGGGQFRGWPEITDHHRRAAQVFAQIPPGAALSAHDRLNPHVSQRQTVYIFDRIEEADYIVLDVTEDSWPLHPLELRHRVEQLLHNGFGLVEAVDGYLLLARTDQAGGRAELSTTLPEAFFDFARVPNPDTFQPRFTSPVIFGDRLRLLGYDLSLEAHEKSLPVLTLYWQALQPLEQNYTLWPFVIDRQGKIIEDPTERPLVTTIWYPTSRWSPDEIIMTRTLPQDLAPEVGDEFTLAVGVADQDWTDPNQRLSITGGDDPLYFYENNTWARLATFRRTGRKTYQPILPDPSPQPQQPRQIQFWNTIDLYGVDLPADSLNPGQDLPFTLYWRPTAPLPVDLTTFAHLLNEQGHKVAQLDWTPQDKLGYLPTTAWQTHRPVVDRQMITLPEELSPGEYDLVTGWYYPVTGERLPVTRSNNQGKNTALLGKITIN